MSKSRTIKNMPTENFSPHQWILAVAGIALFLLLFSNIFGFIIMFTVAFGIGYAANYILPTKIPYGYLGSTGVGLAGAWLGMKLLGEWGPPLGGIRIIPGIIGALAVTALLQVKLNADRAKNLEAIKASADPDDPFLMKDLDGFILAEPLGSGANSRVYLGVPADSLDRSKAVACKLLNEEATKGKDALARYGREIRIAHKLDHPGIVKMYSWGEQGKLLFIIMEYVKGGTLSDVVKPGGLPLKQARELMGQLTTALLHAHDHDIVHRDIKPANILISNGRTKISDFGLGRAITDDVSLTKEGTVLGTPAYIAPEQIQGKKPSASCDQYALGVLFYELLTGRRPFQSTDSVALLMMQLQEKPQDPSELREGLPEKMAAMVLKMMEKDPADRYPSLKEVNLTLKDIDEELDVTDKEKEKEAAKAAESSEEY
jgi:tRNA A-37 threonylcarbamoyl transferase component Bud32/uncharacterized membrane protein YeaQ/YmgE (transglycosylase-associated protein family)